MNSAQDRPCNVEHLGRSVCELWLSTCFAHRQRIKLKDLALMNLIKNSPKSSNPRTFTRFDEISSDCQICHFRYYDIREHVKVIETCFLGNKRTSKKRKSYFQLSLEVDGALIECVCCCRGLGNV